MARMRRIFFLQAAVLILIAYLYLYLGIHLRYVFTISWWDIVLHMLGGAWVALASVWFFGLFGIRRSIIQCVLIALSVGLAWELFEYIFGIGGSNFMSYRLDTAKDLLDDMIGGAIAGYVAQKIS